MIQKVSFWNTIFWFSVSFERFLSPILKNVAIWLFYCFNEIPKHEQHPNTLIIPRVISVAG